MLCRCGCGRALTPDQIRRGGTYATRPCAREAVFRSFSRQERRQHFADWMRSDAARAHAALGHGKGGAAPHPRFAHLLEKWMDQGPREALRQAYNNGYCDGYSVGKRVRRRSHAA